MKRLSAAAVAVCSLGAVASSEAAIITQFTFENYTVPANPGNIASGVFTGPSADTGTGVFSSNHVASSVYSTPAGNGTTKSFSSNGWSNLDYYQFTSTQAATPGLELEFAQVSSSTGPVSFQLEYSTDGTTFNNVPNGLYTINTSSAASFSTLAVKSTNPPTYLFDFTGMTDIESATSLTFRLVDESATGASTGTDRVDTVTLGTDLPVPSPIPEPASIGLLVATTGAMIARRRRR